MWGLTHVTDMAMWIPFQMRLSCLLECLFLSERLLDTALLKRAALSFSSDADSRFCLHVLLQSVLFQCSASTVTYFDYHDFILTLPSLFVHINLFGVNIRITLGKPPCTAQGKTYSTCK